MTECAPAVLGLGNEFDLDLCTVFSLGGSFLSVFVFVGSFVAEICVRLENKDIVEARSGCLGREVSFVGPAADLSLFVIAR